MSDSSFTLCRLPTNSDDDQRLFLPKLVSHYDWLALPQSAVR